MSRQIYQNIKDSAKFGERIMLARRQIDINQEDFAKKIGVSSTTLNRWENGHTYPNVVEIEKIIIEAKQSIEFFFPQFINLFFR